MKWHCIYGYISMAKAKVIPLPVQQKELQKASGHQEEAFIREQLQAIKSNALNQTAYQRLMVIYRKQKQFAKELKVIEKAIHAFEASFYSSRRKNHGKRINNLSKQINVAMKLTDKKGNRHTDPEPILSWKKRKLTVLKKLEAAQS